MKKSLLTFIIAGAVLVTTGIWVYSTVEPLKIADVLMFSVIGIVIAFAVLIGIRRFRSERRGEPAEDELSKRIMRRTAARAYYVSLYLWLAIMFFTDNSTIPTHEVIGGGILGMALVYALSWVFSYLKGVKDA